MLSAAVGPCPRWHIEKTGRKISVGLCDNRNLTIKLTFSRTRYQQLGMLLGWLGENSITNWRHYCFGWYCNTCTAKSIVQTGICRILITKYNSRFPIRSGNGWAAWGCQHSARTNVDSILLASIPVHFHIPVQFHRKCARYADRNDNSEWNFKEFYVPIRVQWVNYQITLSSVNPNFWSPVLHAWLARPYW